jgi:hypothetical protein
VPVGVGVCALVGETTIANTIKTANILNILLFIKFSPSKNYLLSLFK